jgi:peptide/nickel transport system substrate-binding protein
VGAKRCAERPRHCDFSPGIVADDEAKTVTFHLTAADPDFLNKLAFSMADATPSGTPDRDVGRTPLPATGPYMIRSFSPSGSWTLERNPRFREWSAEAQPDGYPNRIVLNAHLSPRKAVSAIERGKADVLMSPPPERVGELARRYTTQLHSDPSAATFAFVLNTRVPPFDRVAVRRALNYALDRERIVGFTGGPLTAQSTCQILPPTLSGYRPYCPYTSDPDSGGSWTAPDLAKAERLVASSGTRGMKVTAWIDSNFPTRPKLGPYVVQVLHDLGYDASLKTQHNPPYPAWPADSRNRAQLAWFTWFQDGPSSPNFIVPLLSCRAFVNRSALNLNLSEFCNKKIDAQMRRASAT